MFKPLLIVSAAAGLVASNAFAHELPPSRFLETAKPYAPYEFLIGDWYSQPKGQNFTIHQQFRWGPGKSYISYATYMRVPGKPEQLHFGGMMVWNGKTRALDYLFALQPGSGAQEKGSVHAEADGSVVRDVEFTGSDGKNGHFRQIFRKSDSGGVITSVMRQTDQGWEASPPGRPGNEPAGKSDRQ